MTCTILCKNKTRYCVYLRMANLANIISITIRGRYSVLRREIQLRLHMLYLQEVI